MKNKLKKFNAWWLTPKGQKVNSIIFWFCFFFVISMWFWVPGYFLPNLSGLLMGFTAGIRFWAWADKLEKRESNDPQTQD
jgi:hypothetical protein